MVAVANVVDIGGIVRLDGFPLGFRTLHINGLVERGGRNRVDALIAADVVDKQVVVVILQLALGRLDVAAELVVKLVNQRIVDKAVGTAPRVGLTPCVPFVPAGHENHHRVLLQCAVELLGEVVAPERCRRAFLLVSVRIGGGVGAPHDVLTVHSGDFMRHIVVVHGDADRNLLRGLVAPLLHRAVVDRLRVGVQPSPLPDSSPTAQEIGRLSAPEGKELPDFGGHGGAVCHQHGLVVQIVPQLLIGAVLVDVVVQRPDLGLAVAVVSERQKEGNLRHVYAVLRCFTPVFKQRMVGTLPCHGAVGVVIEHNIHACVRQQLCLLAENPLVRGTVVAVDRLVPEAVMPRSLPCSVVIVVLCIRILFKQFGRIGCALLTQLLVPCPVKQCQRLALAHGTYVVIGQRLAPQPVGKHPCVRHGGIVVEQTVLRDDCLPGRCFRVLLFRRKIGKALFRLGGKVDGQAQVELFLGAADIHQSAGHAVAFHCPHADLSARLADHDIVFPGRLCVKGQFRHAVVGQRIKKSSRNRLACLGSRMIPVPLIQGEQCGGIGCAPCAQRQRHRIKRTVDAKP